MRVHAYDDKHPQMKEQQITDEQEPNQWIPPEKLSRHEGVRIEKVDSPFYPLCRPHPHILQVGDNLVV